MSDRVKSHTTYKALAWIYDDLMKDVDYEHWANFIDAIIQKHHPSPFHILELGCGTGTMALSLDELMCYDITATDKSPEMIEVARQKAGRQSTNRITFKVADFLDLSTIPNNHFDIVVMTFDSINYLYEEKEIHTLLEQVKEVLDDGGLFIFDFTTPKNSREAIHSLDGEEGSCLNYYYHRQSDYHEEERIHTNIFTIQKRDPDTDELLESFQEEHHQRIYSPEEMLNIVGKSDFELISKYGGFELKNANKESLRITMTLKCPQMP